MRSQFPSAPAAIAAIAIAALAAVAPAHAAGALSVTREATVDSTPDTVWKLVGAFNGLDVWHPAVKGSTVKGSVTKPGAVRTLDLGGGATIVEKLTAFNPAARSYSYAILSSPLPVKHYASTLTVSAAEGGKARITWTSTFDASDAPDAKATEVVQGIYDAGLARVVADFKN
ncbi:MAG: SRPBCC family protein [Leptothrix sp. (in: b-proteobacteria)]